jgi:cytosine/adenosine deaminase-related metal-dependent hydrolase
MSLRSGEMATTFVNAHVVVMDEAGTEYPDGWVQVDGGAISAVGDGQPPDGQRVDLGGALVTPGLVNTHHHLFQALTRTRAQEADLFSWLAELYPLWARIDAEAEYAAARAGLGELALSGCSTVFDHHYVFPRGTAGLVEAEIQAARELGVRIVAARGSMDLGQSQGGLPPDELVEEIDAVLADTEGLAVLHEPDAGALAQVVVAPCSPFSVTKRLMIESAELARRLGLRLHTHLAETVEEEEFCRGVFGCRPIEYLEQVGWLAGDVWCAHCVHLSPDDAAALGRAGTGVAHCPTSNLRLGAGIAPVRELLSAGAPVGLGVDGPASNERSSLSLEAKQALLVARARGGPAALTAREALRLATRGGAEVLGRADIGSLEPSKCADLAIWRTDGLPFAGADDPVAALVLAAPHRVDRLLVGGEEVVRDGRLVRADEDDLARALRSQSARLAA